LCCGSAAAVAATACVKWLSTANQLKALQNEVNEAQANILQCFNESRNVVRNNKDIIHSFEERLNETAMNQTWQLNYMKNYVDVVAEAVASSATSNLSANLVSQLIHSLKEGHTFHSCAAIAALSLPFPSGMYWIEVSNGLSVQVYCYFNKSLMCKGQPGGWRRVANLDTKLTGNNTKCPPNFNLLHDPFSCKTSTHGQSCTSVIYSVMDSFYSCIYGRIHALQSGSPDGFLAPDMYNRNGDPTLEENYVDGVSLTYGENPKRHIWTFAAGLIYHGNKCERCDRNLPTFIGNDYSCEINKLCPINTIYCNKPLWDGDQCLGQETFRRELNASIRDDIEMRVCRDQERSDEDFLITRVELYVQ